MKNRGLAICIAAFAVSAVAQTVTGSGSSGTVPVFTGTSAVGNSPISVLSSNVGIGTTTPQDELDLGQGALRWDDIYQPTYYYARSFLNINGSGNGNLTTWHFKFSHGQTVHRLHL